MEERIVEVLKEHYEEVLDYEGENMIEEGIIDSFTVLNMVNDFEVRFNIEIPAKCVLPKYFRNKESIITLICKLVGGENS